jgi:hypothetical protein
VSIQQKRRAVKPKRSRWSPHSDWYVQ